MRAWAESGVQRKKSSFPFFMPLRAVTCRREERWGGEGKAHRGVRYSHFHRSDSTSVSLKSNLVVKDGKAGLR